MKRLFLYVCLLALPLNLMAFEWVQWDCGWDLAFRTAAVRPTDKKFRRRYSNWGVEYQGEVRKEICNCTYAWLNVGWMSNRGHRRRFERFESRRFGGERRHVKVLPVSFGLLQKFCITPCANFYLGLGASYAFVRFERDHHARFFRRHNRNNNGSWGGAIKAGFQYRIWECAFIDLFVDYYFQPSVRHHDGLRRRRGGDGDGLSRGFRSNRRNHQLNALKVGAGIGVNF